MVMRRRAKMWLWIVLGTFLLVPALLALAGMALPRDHVARRQLVVRTAPERVWAIVSDVGSTARWRKDVTTVELEAAPGTTVRFAETSGSGTVRFEVEVQEPLRRQVVRVVDEGQPFGGTWTWELEPDGPGTRLTITEAGFVSNPIFRVIAALFMKPTASLDAYLSALAAELGESAVPGDPPAR